MVWNKDLAKLKQELKTDEKVDPKRTIPKPSVKPVVPRELDDEDALFLAAMGGRRKAAPSTPEAPREEAPAPQAPPEDFTEAMASLKGVKPVSASKIPVRKEPVAPPALPAIPETPLEVQAAVELPLASPEETPEPPRWSPPLIQLAAGMAVEVEGFLDLRGHSSTDAVERLKERILDGHLLGWRTFHIVLGPSEDLRLTFLDFLAGPEAGLIARYAQAPIPMGGSQAWILYLGLSGASTHGERTSS